MMQLMEAERLRLGFFLILLNVNQFCSCLTSNTAAPIAQPPQAKQINNRLQKILLYGFAAFLAISTLGLLLIFRRRSSKPTRRYRFGDSARKYLSEIHQFRFSELKQATNNFSEGRCLGRGGFSTVFAGILPDGKTVAIKLLNCSPKQASPQFMSEIAILTQVEHNNLVHLIGCSLDGEALALVYEYVSNGNLFDHLHNKRTKMPWLTRFNVAVSMAQVLAILHSFNILHRDVKSSNVLLDDFCSPKLGDFGLSRCSSDSLVFTAPQGTVGYLDPEYHNCYRLSDKSDVYSFGVVLMELITGKTAVSFTTEGRPVNLASYALGMIQSGLIDQIIDPSLETNRNCRVRHMVLQVAEIAFRCLAVNREDRPSMSDVAASLTSISAL